MVVSCVAWKWLLDESLAQTAESAIPAAPDRNLPTLHEPCRTTSYLNDNNIRISEQGKKNCKS